MKKLFLFSGFLFLSGSFYWLGASRSVDFFPAQREFQITYKASIPEFPQAAEHIRIWIPIASSREGQTILERKIESTVPYQITHELANNNEVAYLEAKKPFPSSLNFNAIYRVRTAEPTFDQQKKEPQDVDFYLKPSRLMVINSEVKTRTVRATAGRKSLGEKARGIYKDVVDWMKYDKVGPGWGRGDTLRACLLGNGNCTDFHSLFISMAHAAEIPARFKIGLTIPEASQGAIPGYHCWA
ncbi:MAG: transglutaminase domain-containing protein, partial [Candidatus Omnitrophica bacterium]|nr:transglutaminase domain-containing protein [Candidatus Omnitrophota bacterium]